MPVENTILIAGLGNPGRRYGKTRHNAGFMVIDDLSRGFAIPLDREKHEIRFGRGIIEGMCVLLAKPMAFMNNSGPPIQRLARFFRIPVQNLLVIHDDIDLDYGRLKMIAKSSHGGHKGIRSLIAAFSTGDFPRLRVGVGRPVSKAETTGHVLGRFTPEEEQILGKIIARSREGVLLFLRKGLTEGMNQINNRTLLISH